jgi:hypothetical protein
MLHKELRFTASVLSGTPQDTISNPKKIFLRLMALTDTKSKNLQGQNVNAHLTREGFLNTGEFVQ